MRRERLKKNCLKKQVQELEIFDCLGEYYPAQIINEGNEKILAKAMNKAGTCDNK